MAKSKAERVRASKLHKKRNLSPVERAWLERYDAEVAVSQAAAKKRNAERFKTQLKTSRRELAASPQNGTYPPVVAGPQLEMGALAQETVPNDAPVDPLASTWSPTVPAPAEGESVPPPTDGSTPNAATAAGAPLVDGAAATVKPAGDPAAAAKFALVICGITNAGMDSLATVTADSPVDGIAHATILSDDARKQTLQIVGASAYALAMKRGWQGGGALSDEATVGIAVAGSAAAWFAAQRKLGKLGGKAKAATAARAATPQPAREERSATPPTVADVAHTPPPSELDELLEDH